LDGRVRAKLITDWPSHKQLNCNEGHTSSKSPALLGAIQDGRFGMAPQLMFAVGVHQAAVSKLDWTAAFF